MELDHVADRKLHAVKQQFRDSEESLLYVRAEKGHSVHLTDQGVDYMSPNDHDAFVLPDISQEVHRIDHDPDMTPEEKLATRQAINVEYAAKSEKLNIVHQLLRAHALYEKDVNYVVQDGQGGVMLILVDEHPQVALRRGESDGVPVDQDPAALVRSHDVRGMRLPVGHDVAGSALPCLRCEPVGEREAGAGDGPAVDGVKRVLLIGGSGRLGTAIRRRWRDCEIVAPSHGGFERLCWQDGPVYLSAQ